MNLSIARSLLIFVGILFISYVKAEENHEAITVAKDMFLKIHKHVPNIQSLDVIDKKGIIPGVYSSIGPTLQEYSGGATSGSYFYIFPDGSYIYTEWADIMAETIYEKGHWDIKNSFITFKNDDSLSKERSTSEYYLPFKLGNGNIVIMGNSWDFTYFSNNYFEGSSPEFIMLLTTHEKVKNINHDDTKLIKDELMEHSWKPWFFAEGYPPHTLKVEAYNESDKVAVIQTLSGRKIPIENGGGIAVEAMVIFPIKGAEMGELLNIYYGASDIGSKYMANLVWDQEVNGYTFYDVNMDISVIDLELKVTSIDEFMWSWGLKGDAISYDDNKYFLPICDTKCDSICQRKFEYVQYMIRQKNNSSSNKSLKPGTPSIGGAP